ncbi:hypothetical protein [Tenacibaculum finnmarkense]|uniref:hypothetical protein n=1 Tax=Tenacibaculum finnmarkense TaxID=2781243 RepID=UPI001E373E35|nr:hypothetical protein [Tenacibaculum finnmarkense]MCD8423530.1 hypothetical protein [Tenacibaculum finnmarkense genomovar ulcerans]MCG8239693.1 hypothetical protein [Tenacibaculum finnmarkense genomovar ulcerans]
MSCFETSTFLKNPQVFKTAIFIEAVKKFNWEYEVISKNEVIVTKIPNTQLYGEFAIKVKNGLVTYNSYYLKNGKELVKELQNEFFTINVEYAKKTILTEFESIGFSLKKDYDFKANEEIKENFFMVGYSKLENEDEKRTEIEFSILKDGTIISDSNYIPYDLHELADKAMEGIEKSFGNRRREGIEIKRKKIPVKYKNKSYCSPSNKIITKN